ncbi:GpE family phage tail protein [Candidatus Williamhamiltonella defendens]|nr:GpE family phage tail protein [Candidatus Hamiltonella defensa]AYB49611.1 GpE family phage tail protein [Candidatus Hamiltonella defensa]CED78841.1 Phage protein [Candidatus Hamiltonella defensa (Bemisia tabaci)]
MADLAAVFHWAPSELWELEIDELTRWHQQAKARAGEIKHG